MRYFRTGKHVAWPFWLIISLIFALVETCFADRVPRLRYSVFNGYFAVLLAWELYWCARHAKGLGIRRVCSVLAIPSLSVALGVFRFSQGIFGQFNRFWFYGGSGESLYRLSLFVVLGAASLYQLRLVNKRISEFMWEDQREHERSQRAILVTVAGFLDNSPFETPGHVIRVGNLAEKMALAIGWDAARAAALNEAAQLHDLGKIAVPDNVLGKSDALTDAELSQIKQHAAVGAEILSYSTLPLYKVAARIAAEHHENWDGSGYPAGLEGGSIAEESRIVSICDVIDALSRPRAYKDAWSSDRIRDYLASERGKKFDPRLVDVAIDIRLWDSCKP
jgi:putative nucleotidyltransferase with HDIG domain